MGAPGTATTWFSDIARESVAGGVEPDPDSLPNVVASSSVGHTAGDLATNLSTGAGATWNDPNITGIQYLRVTDTTYPTTGSGFSPDYSFGGPYMSQVWTSSTSGSEKEYVTVACTQVQSDFVSYAARWLIDVNLTDMSVENERTLSTDGDNSVAFSLSTSSKRHMFYASAGSLRRRNTATDADDHTGRFDHFPLSGTTADISSGTWVMNSRGDNRVKWEDLGSGSRFIVHDVDTETNVVVSTTGNKFDAGQSGASLNEVYLSRDGAYISYIDNADSSFDVVVISGEVGVGSLPRGGSTGNSAAVHTAVIDDLVSFVEQGNQLHYTARWTSTGFASPIQTSTDPVLYGGASQPGSHDNAGWILGNTEEWQLTSPDSGPNQGGAGAAHRHGVMFTPGGTKVKTLFYSDCETVPDNYKQNAFGNLSPDGRAFMFGSPLNSTGRVDLIFGKMPTK